ncbi:MAG TPA: NAD(P)H-dependent oxidoreductase subunit E [Candidatus Methylomirabilis sp.]|nr:NAD(P)H-dependent oxidoreductase subunit E [Candidatus Methylomirabilis sp.]
MTDRAVATETLARFPRERTWLLPALQAVQELVGHLPDWALADVGRHLRIPASEVYGVATHYPEFRRWPRGTHHVRVCTGVSCTLSGGRALLEAVCHRHGVKPGEVGEGRDLTVEEADCLFECAVAPVLDVDGAYRGRVTLDDVGRLDRWYRAQQTSHVHRAATTPSREILPSGSSAEAVLDGLVTAAATRRRRRPPLRLVVHAGTCGRAMGADVVAAALRQGAATRALEAEVIEGACAGNCYAAPVIEVQKEGWHRFVIERVDPVTVPALLERLTTDGDEFGGAGLSGVVWADASWRSLTPAAQHPFWMRQTRVLMARCGLLDPEDLDDALLHGAYRALARALGRPPVEIIETVKASGLQGRGGAFFPTGLKWEGCRRAAGEPKYVVVNGEEGEPGIFKDRHLMEGDPHQLLEGALLAAYAAGATRVIVYVHGEAVLSAARLARAIEGAAAVGIIGDRMLGTEARCHVELRRGAGGFVLGEETALLESIEGRRAQPRTRPPFPVESGLWGKPTVINNVETLSTIPSIVGAGAASFAAHGTPKAPGTKVFGLSGPISRPGVVEVNNGVTLRMLLEEIGGGIADGRAWQGAVVGGPSGTIVPAALFDVSMEPRERVSPGTGGIVAVPVGASVADIVKTLLRFNAGESCGKCTPCREGTPRLLAMIDEVGTGGRQTWRAGLEALAEAVQLASLCGLGQAAPLALLRALETFPDAFGERP